jgi:hypothetical protein
MRVAKTVCVIAALSCLALPHEALAQAALTGSIAGVVRDTTGAVLPGVAVEAASPALIERTRSVTTDAQGLYRIVDLRPGAYTVTFTLQGFTSVTREGLELNAGFTATVNADLQVGTLAETVIVSGASPVIDTQNARAQNVLTRDVLDTVPTAKNFQGFIALTLGASSTSTDGQRDVGGDQGESVYGPKIHGGTSGEVVVEGLRVNGVAYASTHRFTVNQLSVQEVVTETGGVTAESDVGGLNINMTLRDGGNRFTGEFNGDYANNRLQSDNLNDSLRTRGLIRSNSTKYVYDRGFGLGGPLKKDQVWFYSSNRWLGSGIQIAGAYFNASPNKLLYVPDLDRPNLAKRYIRDNTLRLTWQAAQKHKLALTSSLQYACLCNWYANQNRGPKSGEADYDLIISPNHLLQGTWTFPATNKLLFSASANYRPEHQRNGVPPEAVGHRSVLELTTGLEYGSLYPQPVLSFYDVYGDHGQQTSWNTSFTTSYITGSHALKAGVSTMRGYQQWGGNGAQFPEAYQFRNQLPVAIFQGALPLQCCSRSNLRINLGMFVQDQWTIKRLTITPGIRFDYLNAYNPAQTFAAGVYTPEFHFAAVDNVPNWKDISPRIGAAYDLFGNGKTAIKASVGRYVNFALLSIANSTNGAFSIASTTTRTWNDANGNFVPDCDLKSTLSNGECGAQANQAFGTQIPTTAYAQSYTRGWNVRPGFWQASVALQHELLPRLALNAAWYRTSYFNFTITDNLAIGPSDFSPISAFQFTVGSGLSDPARQTGAGAYTISGLYDINPNKFGQVNNLVRPAADFGKQSQIYNGLELQLHGRFGKGQIHGGIISARTVFDRCFLVDSPQELRYCRTVLNWGADTQVKLSGSYELPWAIQVSAALQNLPGIPIPSNYSFPNALLASYLGRNLGQCGSSAVCTGTLTTTVADPNSLFERRETQLDLRFGKSIRTSRLVFRPRFDIYNILNESSVQRLISTVGPSWQQPLLILGGRTMKVGAPVTF